MNEAALVIDTNVFFALLLRRASALRRRFLGGTVHTFYCPRFFLVELFKQSVKP